MYSNALLNIAEGLKQQAEARKKQEQKVDEQNQVEKEQIEKEAEAFSVENLAKLPAEEQIKLLSSEVLRLTELVKGDG